MNPTVRLSKLIVTVATTAFLYGTAVADERVPKARPMAYIDQYGLFVAAHDHEAKRADLGQVTELEDVLFLKRTSVIPCDLGTRFGVTFDILHIPEEQFPVVLEVLWTHPNLRLPDGRTVSEHRYEWKATDPIHIHLSWAFEQDFERIPGAWTISVSEHGQTILEKEFEVRCSGRDQAAL